MTKVPLLVFAVAFCVVSTVFILMGADAGAAHATLAAFGPDGSGILAAAASVAAMRAELTDLETRAKQMEGRITDRSSEAEVKRIQGEHKSIVGQIEALKPRILDAMAEESNRHAIFPHVEVGGRAGFENPEFRAAAMGEALFHRIAPKHQLSEPAREFAGLTIPDMARQCLEFAGHSTRGMAAAQLVTRGLHTTSDYPMVLSDAVIRLLRMPYETPDSGVRMVARQTTARDFKSKHSLQLSGGPGLEKVNEHGEFTRGTFNEAGESYKIDTFGKVFGITRQALVNDDLGAFDRVPRALGQAALAFEATFLANVVAANPAMSDTKTLFHADHGNLASAGAAPAVATLSTARTALRRQTGLQGELISVPPKYLLVPAELETVGEQVLATLAAAKVDDVNPFPGRLELIVEPRFTDPARWYVVADPGVIDGLEFAYLEGEEGPQVDTRAGFDVDGVEFKVRLDFGGGFVDWRGWYANPGE